MDDRLNERRIVRFITFGLVGGFAGAALTFGYAMSVLSAVNNTGQVSPDVAFCGNSLIGAAIVLFVGTPTVGIVTGVFTACLGALTARKSP